MAENNLGVGCHSPSPQRMTLSRSCWQPVGVRPLLKKEPASWRLSAVFLSTPCISKNSSSLLLLGTAVHLEGGLARDRTPAPACRQSREPTPAGQDREVRAPRPGHTHTWARHCSPGAGGTEAPGSPVPSG